MFFGADSKKNKSVLESDELRFKKNVERSPKQRMNSLLWADRHSDDNPQDENNLYQRFPFEPRA